MTKVMFCTLTFKVIHIHVNQHKFQLKGQNVQQCDVSTDPAALVFPSLELNRFVGLL